MFRNRLREALAAIVVILLVAGFTLYFRWRYAEPDHSAEQIEAEIVGFHGVLDEARMRNVTLASVRLPNGQIANVRWQEGRARYCRVGHRINLVRFGSRLRVADGRCYRATLRSSRGPLRASE
jgi:hypothetical protein